MDGLKGQAPKDKKFASMVSIYTKNSLTLNAISGCCLARKCFVGYKRGSGSESLF